MSRYCLLLQFRQNKKSYFIKNYTMEKIARFGKTIRNNWKKSAVGVLAFFFSVDKAKEKYEIYLLMQAACKEAAKHGDAAITMDRNPTLITVILNPVANKRKAKQDFEKYCEPILHLAGLQVDVIQTSSEGHAKEIIESLKGTEAIIVAGGDGTLSETITGLLRRNDEANRFPLGVLPLGRTNSVGNTLFPSPGTKSTQKVKQLIDASMAIVKGNIVWKDAMKIEPIAFGDELPNRPIYAMSAIEWGAFRDTVAKRDKYWYFGSLRDYATFIFNGYKDTLTWKCCGTIKYTPPCAGCSNCIKKRVMVKRKWSSFILPSTEKAQHDESKLLNPICSRTHELCFKTADFKIETQNHKHNQPSALSIVIGKNNYSYTEFVAEGCKRLKNEDNTEPIYARTVELIPETFDKELTIEIDKEEFEVKPVKITILPKVIKLFCAPN